ncbi:polysaccharide deacetylase family protein [Paenibacillus sp. BR2-3]|uniref:polysaccharide deacetylase n=1 Tax=Paenibacillus sp. BR2-3 TaxID=3048494 RepID=UPI003977C748
MRGNKKAGSRRPMLRGLLFILVIILAIAGGASGIIDLELKPHPLQAASLKTGTPNLQEKPPAAASQIISAGVKNSSAAAELNITQASRISPVKAKINATRKMVYLTFDDGPSPVTPKVLDILQREGVKATFFVLGDGAKSHPELINAIWEQGHAIGNHTYDHNYSELYSGFTQFWSQIKKTEEIVRNITGTRPQLVRAPGGTFGHFDDTYFSLLKQAGYLVMDWNVDSGDSKRRGVPADEIVKEAVANTTDSSIVLLLHDGGGHEESAKALPEIIARYKAAGYTFGVLDNDVKPVQFRVSSRIADTGRIKPSAAWIGANITANGTLFEDGKPLVLEVGKLETKLKPGEYLIDQGQYRVPIRAVIQRLGGQVSWDKASRSGTITLNGRSFLADVGNKELIYKEINGEITVKPETLNMFGGAMWMSLRDLLEILGHPPLAVSATAEERRVKAF